MRTTRYQSKKNFSPSTNNISNAFRFGIFGIIALVLMGKGCQKEKDCGPNHDQECSNSGGGSGSHHSYGGSSASSKSSFFSSSGDNGGGSFHFGG